MTSAKFLWLLRDFVPEYYRAKFGINWTTNKGKTEGGTMYPPAYILLKYPSLNRVKGGSFEFHANLLTIINVLISTWLFKMNKTNCFHFYFLIPDVFKIHLG